MIKKAVKRIISFFKTNWPIKLVILFGVTILWVFVASTQATVGKFPQPIDIKTINVANGYSAIYDQKQVNIEVMADPATWRSLSKNSFTAYIDVSSVGEGTFNLPVSVNTSVTNVKITKIDPATVIVRVEKNISKKVTVNQRIEGSAAEGLVVGSVIFSPPEVEITGPSSVVNLITEAVGVIRLNGEASDFEKTIKPVSFDENGQIISNISFNPADVSAKVPIIKASNNKTVGIKVKTTGAPKDGFYISKISPNPNTVNIVGAADALSSINFIETSDLDITGIGQNISKDITLKIPAGVVLESGESGHVSVVISVAETTTSRQISAKISYVNLDPNLKVTAVDPSDVKVLISGPTSQVSAITSDDITLPINLAGKGAGAFNYDINLSSIGSPGNISVLSVVPSALSVTLSAK